MEIIKLSKEEFDNFALNHKYRSFYQSSQYGTLMSRHGFDDIYLGFLNDNQKIEAVTLILCRKSLGNKAIGYAPRGFLVDYENQMLLENFTNTLKKYLNKMGFIYVTIDPCVINIKRNVYGEQIESDEKSKQIFETLRETGYQHLGFNKYFEALKPRWNMITYSKDNSVKMFSNFEKSTRNRIRKMNNSGVHIYKGTADDMILFYNLIQKKHTKRNLTYYLDYYETFSKKGMFEIYFAALNPEEYLLSCRKDYELESSHNNELVEYMENNKNIDENLLNKKIESDRLLNTYQKNMIYATELLKKNKDNILLNTTAVIKYDKEINFLIDGFNPKYKSISAAHLLKWSIMDKYIKEGYTIFNHNGITGDFSSTNKYYGLYQFKRGFDAEVIEYIGEFNLIVNSRLYTTYQGIRPLGSLIKNIFKK